MNDAKVYVTQEVQLDYSDAEQYGTLEFLTNQDLHNTKGSLHNERLLADLRHRLRRITDGDYVLISGSPYVTAAVFLTLGALGVREVSVLRWDNRARHYVPLHVALPVGGA